MTDSFQPLRSALADRYRIERELGQGGMAVVFLAEDLKHHRPAAIKVLRPELTALLGPERFLREIEIAAQLQHPHILTLRDSGAAGGLLYYVMPYIEGESLRRRLVRDRQLPVADALQIARDVASALDYAHRHRVVHRDIKPENILLEEGHALVADFGIARAVVAAGGPKATPTGAVLGTPAYMSPEQAMGGGALDGRSDVYSLGCVLYELLAGQPPFTGATEESVVHQHLSVEPRPVTALRPAVPGEVERALTRALAKSPADRFATAAQFAEALPIGAAPGVGVGRGPGRARGRLIAAAIAAVLAIAGLVAWRNQAELRALFRGHGTAQAARTDWILVAEFDGPPDDPNLAAAVRDLVSAGLDQSGSVVTVSRDQIRLGLQSAGKSDSAHLTPALAQELAVRGGVRTVLEGRIDRVGRGYAVVLQVVDAEDGHTVLTANAAVAGDDALMPAINGLTQQLRRKLGDRESALRTTQPPPQVFTTPSFEAYRKLVEGRKRMLETLDPRGALPIFREALALDPDFAAAWLAMGLAYLNLRQLDSSQVCYQEALRRPNRLTRQQRLIVEAMLAQTRHDLPAALVAYDRLLEDPGPLAMAAHVNRGWVLNLAGRYEDALDDYDQAVRLSPFGGPQAVGHKLPILIRLGRLDEARRIIPEVSVRGERYYWSLGLQVAAGDWARAESLATAYQADATTEGELRAQAESVIGAQQAARGEVKAAARTLERARAAAEKAGATEALHRLLRTEVLLAMVSGAAAPRPGGAIGRDTTTTGLITRGLLAVGTGDLEAARRLLGAIHARPAIELELHGGGPLYLEAVIAARARRWPRVLDLLAPTARPEEKLGYSLVGIGPGPMKWLVGEAYEHLGRPDSAAACFEMAASENRLGWEDRPPVRLLSSFGHRRLVLLYARLGRLEDARPHWKDFSETFTRPDPEMQPLIDEARAALTSAAGMAKSASAFEEERVLLRSIDR